MIVEGGYIRVVQDVRGKYGSEGDYVMNRPLRGPQNPTPVDHATDTYDTIDWLVKNVPESNGRVGILGISYDGFLPLMALVNPHPALKVSVPMNPMVDGWRGDDWFHNGAFRQQMMAVHLRPGGDALERRSSGGRATSTTTTCSWQAGSAGELGRRRGLEQVGFWRKILEHPATTRSGATRRWTSCWRPQPLSVPVMLVHSLWDQEDIYGAPAVYKAIEPKDTGNDKVFLVMGPWYHGQEIDDGSSLGALRFDSDTALTFRREILRPVPRPVPQGRRAEGRRRAGHGVRDRDERLAAPPCMARRLRERLHGQADAALSQRGPEAGLRRAGPRRRDRSRSTSPTRPSRCPSAPAPSSPSATTTA